MKAVIHTPTNVMENSVSFYEKLGYQRIQDENTVLFTDGQAVIEINPERYARAGIKLYKQSWSDEVSKLREIAAVISSKDGFLLSDPSGVWIYLIERELEVNFPSLERSFGLPGNFVGLSLETTDIKKSLDIYNLLGFITIAGNIDQGFVSLSAEGFKISLMKPLICPHLFFNPSMTYFNGGNNLPVIAGIRELNIPIAEEITYFNKEGIVDNIIIRDPGGYGFFIFND